MKILELYRPRIKIKKDGCWVWKKCNILGYGYARRNNKNWMVHRLSWILENGPIPKGLWVLHKCDIKKCCNPNHLFLGTSRDNMLDLINKGKFNPPRGVINGSAKLKPKQVLAIREDPRQYKEIAAQYNIGTTTVCNIKSRVRWGHLP